MLIFSPLSATLLSYLIICGAFFPLSLLDFPVMSSAKKDIFALPFHVLCKGKCYPICFSLTIIL